MIQFLTFCERYWYVLSFFGGLIVHAIWFWFTTVDHEKRIRMLEGKQEPMEALLQRMDTKLNILVEGYKQ